MSLNAAVTPDGGEIGHAQWVQALAAGVDAEVAMNPILLKPTGENTSQVVVLGQPAGTRPSDADDETKDDLLLVVLSALADLRSRFDVVICEGAGSPAEINLLDHDLVNLPLADAAGLPALLVGDIERGGVFATLFGTVALLPDHLRTRIQGFVVNKLRGDPALLGDACAQLERRCGVPTLGVLPYLRGPDIDAEDSLALDRVDPEPPGRETGDILDVAAVRWPHISNAGDLDPLRLEPAVRVRWVRSVADLGQPDLVVLPGSKATRDDLAWFRRCGLADAVEYVDATVVGICAGLQMIGGTIADIDGVEGSPGVDKGMDWLPATTTFELTKVLDRPAGAVVAGPGTGQHVAGYRIHHGRVTGESDAALWLVANDGTPLGWQAGWVAGTTLHGLFDSDGFRTALLRWAARRTGKRWQPGTTGFAAARLGRLDRIADLIEDHLDIGRIDEIIGQGAP